MFTVRTEIFHGAFKKQLIWLSTEISRVKGTLYNRDNMNAIK